MANQLKFTQQLQQALNESNARNLELQAELACKHDECSSALDKAKAAESHITSYKAELKRLQTDLANKEQEAENYRELAERLQRQLQAEKSHNVSASGYTTAKNFQDPDDEDFLPSESAREPTTKQSQAKAPTNKPASNIQKKLSLHKSKPVATFATSLPIRPGNALASQKANAASELYTFSSDTPKKRTRQEQDEINADAEDLKGFTFSMPSGRRKKSRIYDLTTETIEESFAFRAMAYYNSNGDPHGFKSTELRGLCTELWDRIRELVESWEECKGEFWTYEFTKTGYKAKIQPCVTTKLAGKGRTLWHDADCEGKFACRKCVAENRPCFTWTGDEFWLLPLRNQDRVRQVQKDFEIRYWVNA